MPSFEGSRWAEALVTVAGDASGEAIELLKILRSSLYGVPAGTKSGVPAFRSQADFYSDHKIAQLLDTSLSKVLPPQGSGELSGIEVARRVAILMARRGHLNRLDEVIEEASLLLDQRSGVLRVRVDTAQALNDPLRNELKTVLLKKLGANSVDLIEQLHGELIAGFRIQIGWQRFDGTLRGKLMALGNAMGAKKRGVL
jgi:F0F1-type ATP synthase delta subunit